MSSGTPVNPYAASQMIASPIGSQVASGGGSAKEAASVSVTLSPRQSRLSHRWSFYRCENYAGRAVDWNGQQVVGVEETSAISTAGYIPPGFVDAGALFPLKFRRPDAPYYMAKVVVDRFTGLLFSQRRHPRITVEGDPDTEDYLNALAEEGRLWSVFMQARTLGGGMGSVAVGFKLVRGKPVFEAHDTRWCNPLFKDRFTGELAAIEKRFAYTEQVRDPESGEWIEAWFWYRRVIDEMGDEVWPKVPVGDGLEPAWAMWRSVRVEHGIGECPVVWIQNLPSQEDIDGDPDCYGAYELIEAHDALMSQAKKSVMANCDPTLFISTKDDMSEVAVGSDNAIKVSEGEGNYIEATGSGAKSATDLADKIRDRAFDVVAYVPDDATDVQETATKVNSRVSRMFEKADLMREQYGERGIKRILEIAEVACRQQSSPRIVKELDEAGVEQRKNVVGIIKLPMRAITENGKTTLLRRKLGPGGVVSLKWPRYFEPTLQDIQLASQAVTQALAGGAIDLEVAANFAANYFPVEDVNAMLERIKKQKNAMQDDLRNAALGAIKGQAIAQQNGGGLKAVQGGKK